MGRMLACWHAYDSHYFTFRCFHEMSWLMRLRFFMSSSAAFSFAAMLSTGSAGTEAVRPKMHSSESIAARLCKHV
jgi:hypothetical protein